MNKFIRWLPALLTMSAVFTLSAIPGQTIDSVGLGSEGIHVSGHFLMFFILFFMLYKATKSYTLSMMILVTFAFTDELHQAFVPARTMSIKDLITDTVAGLSAGGILWFTHQNLPKKLKDWLSN